MPRSAALRAGSPFTGLGAVFMKFFRKKKDEVPPAVPPAA